TKAVSSTWSGRPAGGRRSPTRRSSGSSTPTGSRGSSPTRSWPASAPWRRPARGSPALSRSAPTRPGGSTPTATATDPTGATEWWPLHPYRFDSRGHDMTVNEPPAWEKRILDTREAINRAIAAHDQAIADAKMSAAPVSQIARVLGRQDRTGLYRAIQRARERTMQAVPQPPHTPVAYVRTRERAGDLRLRVEIALRPRGIATMSVWPDVWYLGMGGVPLLQINLEETTLAEGRPETAPGVYRVVAREEPEDGLRVLRTVESRRLPTRRSEDGIGSVTDVDALAALSVELLAPYC